MLFHYLTALGLLVLMLAQSAPAAPSPADAFFAEKIDAMDGAIMRTIKEGETPGVVFWVERQGTAYHRAYGQMALEPQPLPNREDTIYDVASLTKVLATTPSIMLLIERGQIKLDAPVCTYMTNFIGGGKEAITVRHLLTHTSGLRPGIALTPAWTGSVHAIELACAEKVQTPPGTSFRYSDINFITLGELVRVVSGRPLNEFVEREIYRPLRMKDTGFLPPASKLKRIAPTQRVNGTMIHGVVHDPTSRCMGGVAGHAGLFTTAADLARFARMMLNEGSLGGARVFKPQTVRLMTTIQSPEGIEDRRGLGWDIDSGYSRPRGAHFPLGSYGHTGWTGTALWIDPFSRTFWFMLSNRVHPNGHGNVLTLQGTLGTLIAESVRDFNFTYVPGALAPLPEKPAPAPKLLPTVPVLNGIDVLVKSNFAPLQGLRVALISNHTGADRERRSTIDLLHEAPGVKLVALFGPEHGIRGDKDEKVGDGVDQKTGLPVYSLYGATRKPKPEQLKDLDALVFDIQDIGCRFYTYISTMGNCLEAAAQAHLKVFVLDRVNPIAPAGIDGPLWEGERSFTAFHRIPVRHGMTVGELARMFNRECGFNADLTVIPVQGWKRDFWYDQTLLPWINPSPNMRSLTEATLYPGIGLLETTALSVGRGTGTPFEVIGAPYIDDVKLAKELNAAGLPGLRFVPVRYTPTASVFEGKECGGVSIVLTSRDQGAVMDAGLLIAGTLHRLHPDKFNIDKFNNLLGDTNTIAALKAGKSIADIRKTWQAGLDDFRKRREPFLLYK